LSRRAVSYRCLGARIGGGGLRPRCDGRWRIVSSPDRLSRIPSHTNEAPKACLGVDADSRGRWWIPGHGRVDPGASRAIHANNRDPAGGPLSQPPAGIPGIRSSRMGLWR
jgi:hypothetical protein